MMYVADFGFSVHSLKFLGRKSTVWFPVTATFSTFLVQKKSFVMITYSQILAGARCFKRLSIQGISGWQWIFPLTRKAVDDIAFTWVNTSLPGVCPRFLRVKIFLEKSVMLMVLYSSVDTAVICEEPGVGVLNCISHLSAEVVRASWWWWLFLACEYLGGRFKDVHRLRFSFLSFFFFFLVVMEIAILLLFSFTPRYLLALVVSSFCLFR